MRQLQEPTAWWQDQDYVERLITAAHHLNDRFPNDHIVGVGHSPSWLVYLVGKIREEQDKPSAISHIGFSGNYTGLVGYGDERDDIYDNNRLNYKLVDRDAPPQSHLSAYYNYCAEHEVEAASVLRRFESTGQKTIFVDLVEKGCGFASFLHSWHIMHEATQNTFDQAALSQAMSAYAYKIYFDRDQADYTMRIINEDRKPLADYPVTLDCSDDAPTVGKNVGSQGAARGITDKDRITPVFDIKALGRAIPELPEIYDETRNTIRNTLSLALARYDKEKTEKALKENPPKSYRGPFWIAGSHFRI